MTDGGPITARMRAAHEAGDLEGVLGTLAQDVVLRSPITDRVVFRGHAEMRELLGALFQTISDVRYLADVGDERTRALFYRGRVGRQPLEEAMRVELDDDGRIKSLTIFYRPLPGLATLTAALGPRVARRHGRVRSLIARVLLAPLGVATRVGDRLTPWFAG